MGVLPRHWVCDMRIHRGIVCFYIPMFASQQIFLPSDDSGRLQRPLRFLLRLLCNQAGYRHSPVSVTYSTVDEASRLYRRQDMSDCHVWVGLIVSLLPKALPLLIPTGTPLSIS